MNWKGGKPRCLDCGTRLSSYVAIRCKPCNKEILSQIKKGRKQPWAKYNLPNRIGYKHTEETKEKMRGANNKKWKGENVGYFALHHWVNRHKGKAQICTFCHKRGKGRSIHWANISHQYKRDLNDYFSLCVSCHKEHDKKGGYIYG